MASVQLANIYEPLTFNAAVDEMAIELNRFLRSGIAVEDARIGAQLSAGGRIGEMAYYGLLDAAAEPNYSSDDPTSFSTPANISGLKDIFRLAAMNNSWSTMDLSRELALKDPLAAIINKVSGWWATQEEKRLIQSALGVLADNVANDSSDMLNAIFIEEGTAAVEANLISAEAVLDTKQTMGDHAENLSGMAVHSVIYTNLQKQNLIDYIVDSEGKVRMPTYLGYNLIVDDSMPVRAGTTDGFVYTTILFAAGVFGAASGNVAVPSEMDRVANSGDGGGEDILHSRRSRVYHPYGFQFTSASVAAESPTLAELAGATNWDRVVARKNTGMAFLQTNG